MYVTLRLPIRIHKKNFSPFSPALWAWPARGNIYINVLFYYHIKSNQIHIFVPSLHYIWNKIFIKHIYENLRRGGIDSQGLFIMLLMGWRELELLERIQFIHVQETFKERSGIGFPSKFRVTVKIRK